MGKKVRWFDAVQRILSPSEPDRDEKEDKQSTQMTDPHRCFRSKKPAERPTSKSSFKKLWQFGKSSTSTSSSSAAPEAAPAAHQQPPPQPDQQDAVEAKSAGTTSEQNDGGLQVAALAAPVAQQQPAAATAVVTPRPPARSKEELAAIRIQTACRGYLVRKGYKARAQARLMSLLEGVAVKRQTEDALYSMQAMTRVQTQIYARRVNKDKALKSQAQPKQGPDKTKIGEVWDHTHQSKEQIEATLATKQEAASRRQRALSYALSHQWRNRSPSSSSSSGRGRATPTLSHPPTFMDPGCPNWGWSWAERCMAASRPWESQTAPPDVKDRAAPGKSAGRAASPRVSISVQIPTTLTGRSARPAGRSSPSTPTQSRSPSALGKTVASPRRAPSPRGSPFNKSGSMLSERPRSSQEHLAASSGGGGDEKEASLRRTTSLRSGEQPRKLSLGTREADAGETGDAPVTPSYMQATKSVKAKARCASPAAADKAELPERAPLVSSPSMKRRPSPEFAEKQGVSSPRTPRTPSTPSKAKPEIRTKRPPSPRL
nr:protein IQ-DOMAIN 3-like [Aegilops tauschii subsp. strangulata]